MRYWRLQVHYGSGLEEDFDLRQLRQIYTGDDTDNEVCIESISVPSKLRIVSLGLKGPQLRLTEEITPSLKGSFTKAKEWKTRLYRGSVFNVDKETTWKIGDTSFRLYQTEKIGLGKYQKQLDPRERKHLFQSFSTSAAAHALILLIIFGVSLIFRQFQAEEEKLEVQKFSIAQVDKLFKPEPEPEPVPEIEVVPEQPKDLPQPKDAPSKAQGAKSAGPKKALAKAVAKGEGAPKKDLKSMGLLALQSVKTSSDRSLSVSKPRVVDQVAVADAGASFSPIGEGIRSGTQTQQVAKLNGISNGGYQSGQLSKGVQSAGNGPSIHLVRKEVEIRGGLDPAIIQQIIEERLTEVRYCYENALLKKVNLSGKISTSWTIQSDGSVANLQSHSSDLQEQELHECVRKRIIQWRFPNPKGGGVVHVKYPFVFSSLGS